MVEKGEKKGMMHDNYDPPQEFELKDGAPTENGFYLIYIDIPGYPDDKGNGMLVQLADGSFYNDAAPDANLDLLLKDRILKHVGPLPYRIK